MKKNHKPSAGQIIATGFLALILLGTLLLYLPFSHVEGKSISLTDALFVATSATCVTGLSTVVVAEVFNAFGKTVIAVLIQCGGLGVACMGAAFALLFRRRMGIKNQSLIREGWNMSSAGGVLNLLKMALSITLITEFVGAVLSFFVFVQDMPPAKAVGTALFHAISAFNNAGFDILGANNLIGYQGNILLTLVTALLIIIGGLGFFVFWDIFEKKCFRKLTLHSKIALSVTGVLLLVGTLIFLFVGNLPLLDAFFLSVSARTAGFMTSPIGSLSQATLFALIFLMFIGASPGSTGGGIKTTTFFAVCLVIRAQISGKKQQVFHRKLPKDSATKALLLLLFALTVVLFSTFLLCVLEPSIPFLDLLVEVVSAAATVGLSTGITATLSIPSKLILTLVMYIGRLGPLSAATIWSIRAESALSYSEESITIG